MQKRKAIAQTREKGVLLLLLWTTIVLLIVRIYVQGLLDVQNEQHYELTEEIKAVKRVNTQLSNKLLQDTALTTLASRAAQEGYVPAAYRILWR